MWTHSILKGSNRIQAWHIVTRRKHLLNEWNAGERHPKISSSAISPFGRWKRILSQTLVILCRNPWQPQVLNSALCCLREGEKQLWQCSCNVWHQVRRMTGTYFNKRIAWLKPSPSICTPWCGISKLDNWKEKSTVIIYHQFYKGNYLF